MHRSSWSVAGPLDFPQVSLDDLSGPIAPPQHTDSQPSTTRAARTTVSAAALSRAEVASEKKKQPKMNAWQDAARDRAQSRRTGAALGNRGLPTNRPRKKVEASPFALLELPGLKLKLGMTVTDDGGKAARAEERARAHEEHRSRVRQLYSQALANRQVASERLGSSVPPDHFLAQQPPSLLAHQPRAGTSTGSVAGFFGPGLDGAADAEGGSDEGSLALGLTLSFGSTAGAPNGVHSSRRARAAPPLPPPPPAPPPPTALWGDYARPKTAPTAADRAAAAAAASAAIHARRALLTGFDSVMVDSVPRQSGLPRGTIGRAGAPPPSSVPLSMDALLWSYPSKSARPPQPPAAGERSTLSATPR